MTRRFQTRYNGDPVVDEFPMLNSYSIRPDEVKGGDTFGYKVVARVWESWNGWCAYYGPAKWSDKDVADYGDELPYETAKLLFPTLAQIRTYGGT